jgi:YD repeat-containing protein
MKKLTMLALAASAFMAFSCSDDDNNSNNNNNNGGNVALSGKWDLTSITSGEAVDGNGDGVSTTNLFVEGGACFTDSYLQFGSNNSVTNFLSVPFFEGNCYTASADGDYDADGNNVTVVLDVEGDTETYEYTKSGNTLTVTVPDFYEIEVTIGENTTTYTLDATMVYTKE